MDICRNFKVWIGKFNLKYVESIVYYSWVSIILGFDYNWILGKLINTIN